MSSFRSSTSTAIRAIRGANVLRAATGPVVARPSAVVVQLAFSTSARRFEASSPSSTASSYATRAVDPSLAAAAVDPVVESSLSSLQPYTISRTASGELPVYSKLRRGNMWKTVIRNVKGDVPALQAELNALFAQGHIDPLTPAPVFTLRPTNRHLEVRGRWVEQVKGWLEERGF